MANLRTTMDSAFWDLNVSSPQTLKGSAKAVPGDPFPLDGARASQALRIQQLFLLGNGFPLGVIPSVQAKISLEKALRISAQLPKGLALWMCSRALTC
ncbi:hypothetical protein ACFX13_041034 [Malus domestica]